MSLTHSSPGYLCLLYLYIVPLVTCVTITILPTALSTMATQCTRYTPPTAAVVITGVPVVLGVVGVLCHGVAGGVQAVLSTDVVTREGAVSINSAQALDDGLVSNSCTQHTLPLHDYRVSQVCIFYYSSQYHHHTYYTVTCSYHFRILATPRSHCPSHSPPPPPGTASTRPWQPSSSLHLDIRFNMISGNTRESMTSITV